MLFSIEILKSIENLIFAAFGKIFLVLANAFFYSNSNEKSTEQLIFSVFGKILVLANFFSIQIPMKKVLKH